MKKTFIRAVQIACLHGLILAQVRADLLDRFQDEYADAAARLEEAYSHVRLVTRHTTPEQKLEQIELLRSGDLIRKKTEQADGRVEVRGGKRQTYWVIEKKKPQDKFVILNYAAHTEFDQQTPVVYPPLFASFYGYDIRVSDYIKRPQIKVTSAEPSKLDGRDVVEVLTYEDTEEGPKPYRFWFLPEQSWALAGCRLAMDGDNYPADKRSWIESRVTYDTSDPPQMKSLELWNTSASQPDVKKNHERYEITSLEFGPIQDDEFRVTAFGVDEPAISRESPNYFWYLVGAVAVLILLAVVFRRLAR